MLSPTEQQEQEARSPHTNEKRDGSKFETGHEKSFADLGIDDYRIDLQGTKSVSSISSLSINSSPDLQEVASLYNHSFIIPIADSDSDSKETRESCLYDLGWLKSWTGNAVWRAMNLAGIGVSGSPRFITGSNLSSICIAVAGVNVLLDAGNYIQAKMREGSSLQNAFREYGRDPQGLRKTLKDALVVGVNVVGWTTGYTFMEKVFPAHKIVDMAMRALAAGAASGAIIGVGTKLTGEDFNVSLKAGLQALVEGFVWSMVADQNIINYIHDHKRNDLAGAIADTGSVATGAAAAFELTGRTMGFFSSQRHAEVKPLTSTESTNETIMSEEEGQQSEAQYQSFSESPFKRG